MSVLSSFSRSSPRLASPTVTIISSASAASTPSSSSMSIPANNFNGSFLQTRAFAKKVGPEHQIRTWKIRAGDEVSVNAGKDKEKEGRVIGIDKMRNCVKVQGCNLRKVYKEGGRAYTIEKKIHYSNVNLLDPVTREPTRVGLV